MIGLELGGHVLTISDWLGIFIICALVWMALLAAK